MTRTGRTFLLASLMLTCLTTQAGDNSLLIPASGRCALDTLPEMLPDALAACRQAALDGDAQAQFELGEFYYQGKLTPRELPQALSWFEKASLQGHAEAQHRLGSMFFRGEGVPANNVQAYIVLKMAAVNGSEEALDSADRVSLQMRREELEIASQVLGQIFRNYLMELRDADNAAAFDVLP